MFRHVDIILNKEVFGNFFSLAHKALQIGRERVYRLLPTINRDPLFASNIKFKTVSFSEILLSLHRLTFYHIAVGRKVKTIFRTSYIKILYIPDRKC
jgi:hypothetical protein